MEKTKKGFSLPKIPAFVAFLFGVACLYYLSTKEPDIKNSKSMFVLYKVGSAEAKTLRWRIEYKDRQQTASKISAAAFAQALDMNSTDLKDEGERYSVPYAELEGRFKGMSQGGISNRGTRFEFDIDVPLQQQMKMMRDVYNIIIKLDAAARMPSP